MPIPGPSVPNVADEIPQTQSPFAIRLNGAWVTLEGVVPGVARSVERPQSEVVTTDGYRFVQRAPRAAREWALDFRYATPAAVAALAVAVEGPEEVLLLDASAARANMLNPTECYGLGPDAVDCGGIPLLAFGNSASDVEVSSAIRGGVTMGVSLWSDASAGVELADVAWPGGSGALVATGGPGVTQCSLAFAAAADGVVTVTIPGSADLTSGLMLVEGVTPTGWLAGERTPCPVSVSDASRTLNLLPATRQGRGDYSVTLREVG